MDQKSGIKFLLLSHQMDLIRAKGNVSAQARAVGLTPTELYNALCGRRKLPIETIEAILALPAHIPRDEVQKRDTTMHGIYDRIERLREEIETKKALLARLEENIGRVEKLMGLHKP